MSGDERQLDVFHAVVVSTHRLELVSNQLHAGFARRDRESRKFRRVVFLPARRCASAESKVKHASIAVRNVTLPHRYTRIHVSYAITQCYLLSVSVAVCLSVSRVLSVCQTLMFCENVWMDRAKFLPRDATLAR